MANNQLKHLLLIGFLTLSCTGVAYAQAPGTSPVETTASATSTDIQLAGIPFVVSSASSQDPEVAQAIASKIEALIKEYGGSVATQPNADAYNAGLSVQIEYSSDEKYQTYQVKIDESLNGSAAGSLRLVNLT